MRANAAATPSWQSEPDLLTPAPLPIPAAGSNGHGDIDLLGGILATSPRTRTFDDVLDLLATAKRAVKTGRKATDKYGEYDDFIFIGPDEDESKAIADYIAKNPNVAISEILIGADEPRVIDEAITALATRDNIYQRGGTLVQVLTGTKPPKGISRPSNSPRITPMKEARIKELLSASAEWYNAGDEEMKKQHPPKWVIDGVLARGEWSGIRPVEAVVESPVLRADGSILQTPGYDAAL